MSDNPMGGAPPGGAPSAPAANYAFQPPAPDPEQGETGYAHKQPIAWEVRHSGTGEVRRYKSSAAASRARDRMDIKHGGSIAHRRAIWE